MITNKTSQSYSEKKKYLENVVKTKHILGAFITCFSSVYCIFFCWEEYGSIKDDCSLDAI